MTINERMFKIMEEKHVKPINLANTLGISKSVSYKRTSRQCPRGGYLRRRQCNHYD